MKRVAPSWMLIIAALLMSIPGVLVSAPGVWAEPQTKSESHPPAAVTFEAVTDSPSLDKRVRIGTFVWTCRAGKCVAKGTDTRRLGVKACVRLSVLLGAKITKLRYGTQLLPAADLKRCQDYFEKSGAQSKPPDPPPSVDEMAADRLPSVQRSPIEVMGALAPGEMELVLDSMVDQQPTPDGGLRFVAHDGRVVVLDSQGYVFSFREDRRFSNKGRFVRWATEDANSPRLDDPRFRNRCAYRRGWETLGSMVIFSSPDRIDWCTNATTVRLVFQTHEQVPWTNFYAASKMAFKADYLDDRLWVTQANTAAAEAQADTAAAQQQLGEFSIKLSPRQSRAVGRVGRASSDAFKTPVHQKLAALKRVQAGIHSCYVWFTGMQPGFEGQGHVRLLMATGSRPATALVYATTYDEGYRLDSCIEQILMQQKYELPRGAHLDAAFEMSIRPEP